MIKDETSQRGERGGGEGKVGREGKRKETLLALIASTDRIEDDLLSLRSSRLPLCIARSPLRSTPLV